MPSNEQMEKDLKYLEVKNAALDISAKRTDIAWKKRAIAFMDYRTRLEQVKYYVLVASIIIAFFFQSVSVVALYLEVSKNENFTGQEKD